VIQIPLNLDRLRKDPQHLTGSVSAEDLELDYHDELIHFNEPLTYELTAEWMEDAALVRGTVRLTVDCECARCLKPFQHIISLEGYALHLPFGGEDAVPIEDNCADLTPFLREDSLLDLPQHPLCRSDCPGLEATHPEPSVTDTIPKPGVWSQLDQLKFDKD
jgi:uncharacterized metal-binding protein YceD (DUF177 family)